MTDDKKRREPREWNRILQRTVGGEWSHSEATSTDAGFQHGRFQTAPYNAPYDTTDSHGKADAILEKLVEIGITGAFIERNHEKRTEKVVIEDNEIRIKGSVLAAYDREQRSRDAA